MDGIDIRESLPGDQGAVLALYPRAFPEEELRPTVAALLDETDGVISLVALSGDLVVGHIVFTDCNVEDSDRRIALLGPLCVDPGHQRKGIGQALISEGIARMDARGVAHVCVLGDPNYYGRSGFLPERGISTPCPIPEKWRDAWQSVSKGEGESRPKGRMIVPAPWRNPTLWSD
ncbi:MAG: GNAT family N-acetyltransferase [Rhodospirillaceae bacterium]|nr:GNAT family N-acetyltransferase [Rhodospirillaceae bacterium]|tara:strand:- start:52 stop:576 length:525 start_codon:yes stop_codon:yes gene_type:complete